MPRLNLRTTDTAGGVKPFREIRATELDAHLLREHIATHGYVLIRNLLFPRDLNLLLTEITQIVSAAKWLDPARPAIDRIVRPGVAFTDSDPTFRRVSDRVFNLETFHAVPHHPTLLATMELLVGPHLLIHPKPIPRLVFPSSKSFRPIPRQDHHAIAGDPQTFTAWIPLHDCSPKHGPLQILEGSHRYGLQKTPPGANIIPIDSVRGNTWVSGRVNAGDVLIFHSLAVHAATANTSNQLRTCLDCRFQSYDRPVNPANLTIAGADDKSWESTYANWRSSRLKYYWKQLPLQLTPSRPELAQLANTAEPAELRARYARMLAQLEP